MKMLGLVALAVLLGLCVTLQGATNGALSDRIGLPSMLLLNAIVVVVLAFLVWLWAPGRFTGDPQPSWLLYLGGVYGLAIVLLAAFLFPRLGAGPTVAVVVAAQLVVALGLDHIGWPGERLPVTPGRICGAVLLVVGALLVLWPRLGVDSVR